MVVVIAIFSILVLISILIMSASMKLAVNLIGKSALSWKKAILIPIVWGSLYFTALYINYAQESINFVRTTASVAIVIINIFAIILVLVMIKRSLNVGILRTIGVFLLTLIFNFIVSLVLVITFNLFIFQSYKIPTGAMEETLQIGDQLLVVRNYLSFAPLKRGVIITFKAPPDMKKEYVKRVIGMPGDRLRVSEKKVFINGQPLDETYVRFRGVDNRVDFPPQNNSDWYFQFPNELRQTQRNPDDSLDYIVPLGYYFCMGDNRDNSFDSRFWGPVPVDNITGRPWLIYWSTENDIDEYLGKNEGSQGLIIHWKRIGNKIQ